MNISFHLNARRFGRGFTLVELLVVLTIMVTLGGMLTYALASAQTDARIKRTEADVLTIGQLLQNRMNEVSLAQISLIYGTPATFPTAANLSGFGNSTNASTFEAQERARLILAARRDYLRMVLPECRADLLYPPASLQFRTQIRRPSAATGGATAGQWQSNIAQVRPPEQWDRMRIMAGLLSGAEIDDRLPNNPVFDPTVDGIAAAYDTAGSPPSFQRPFNLFSTPYDPAGPTGPVDDDIEDDPALPATAGEPNDLFWSRENESAECLYLILATTELFGKRAVDKLPSTSIGNTDGDSIPEILDSWGNPYEFMRSPTGLRSRAIRNFDRAAASTTTQYPSDPDPFDFLLADFRYDAANFPSPGPNPLTPYHPFYVPPVVISAGPDRQFGMLRTFWTEGGSTFGVKDFYSASAVQISSNAPSPRYSIAYRYPDPFFNILSTPFSGGHIGHDFTITGIKDARDGGGLGGTVNSGFTADNITSLDADF